MQFPKLTPLQARFAASFGASVLLCIIYYGLSNPRFAYAAKFDAIPSDDHNFDRIRADLVADNSFEVSWSPVLAAERSTEEKEHENGIASLSKKEPRYTQLANNDVAAVSIRPGATNYYQITSDVIFGPYQDAGSGLPSPMNKIDTSPGTPEDVIIDGDDLLEERGAADGVRLSEKRRDTQNTRNVYITATTCQQPQTNSTVSGPPPQLTLFVSASGTNQSPGPNASDGAQAFPLEEGHVSAMVPASGDIYMGLSAPGISQSTRGTWSYEISASIDAPFHTYSSDQMLLLMDTDSTSALFVSDNLTDADSSDPVYQRWMGLSPPFTMFVHEADDPAIQGVRRSYCGLQNYASVQSKAKQESSLTTAMTTRGKGNKPKQQFYMTNLRRGTSYYGFMAMDGNSTASGANVVGGGGQVWNLTQFTTKFDANCQLIFNLSFCQPVAYAVPTTVRNDSASSTDAMDAVTSLAQYYDSHAQSLYRNFSFSLQQIPCNTTQTARYSLVRDCDDCNAAYIDWLCAVTIPRCVDYSATQPWLQPRNVNPQAFQDYASGIAGQPLPSSTSGPAPDPADLTDNITFNGQTPQQILGEPYVPMSKAPSEFKYKETSLGATLSSNSSRNRIAGIGAGPDYAIRPGPYKELLPCADVCYNLVQSCPSQLGFTCPLPGRGLERDYGFWDDRTGGGLKCSKFGAAVNGTGVKRSAASSRTASSAWRGGVALGTGFLVVALGSGIL